MNRTQQILTGVLVVQIILAVFVLWPAPAKAAGVPLLGGITADQIVSFTVADNSGNEVTLEKSGDIWTIQNTDGFPADSEAVKTALENLVQVKTGRTVTTTSESHARLQIADDDFLRRITVKDEQGKVYVLYLGSSLSASATHVRMADSDEVMLTDKVTSYDFGSEVKNWITLSFVNLPREKMTKITLQNPTGTYEFNNEGTAEEMKWTMVGLKTGEVFNQNNLVSLITTISNLQMTEPLGKTALPEYGMDAPSAVITIGYTDDSGNPQQMELTVGALDETDATYYVKASSSDYYVKVQSFTLKNFVERVKKDFLEEPTAEATLTPVP